MKSRLVSALLAVLLLTGCGQAAQSPSGVDNMEATVIEEAEVSVEAEAVEEDAQEPYILTFEASTIEGDALTSEYLSRSKLTMLNVWATYCSPCLNEMPDLGEIAAAYDAAEFQIVGIISDVPEGSDEETIANAKALIQQTGANYPHLLLNQSLFSNLVGAVDAVPTTFFVNQRGELMGYLVGSYPKEDWEGIINELLAEVG